MRVTNDEWMEISFELEKHHAVFYQFWQMGKPVFTDTVKTACVIFDKDGDCVSFQFNPDFWKKLDKQSKLFILCHEMMHVVLDHGIRSKDGNDNLCNTAMDIAVNQLLIDRFGFER